MGGANEGGMGVREKLEVLLSWSLLKTTLLSAMFCWSDVTGE